MGLQATFHRGDMSTWQGEMTYKSLLAPAFTFQLASDPLSTLQHWQMLLHPGGGLYMTVFMPYAELLGDLPENQWYEDHKVTLSDGRHGLLETYHELDMENQLLKRQHRYSISGNPPLHHESKQVIRWFEHGQLTNLLNDAGFRVDRFFLDFDPNFTPKNPDLENFDGILTYHATRL
jgi:hypothetical protein